MNIEIEYFKSIGYVLLNHNDLILLHRYDKYTTTVYYNGRYRHYDPSHITDDFNSNDLNGVNFSFIDYIKFDMLYGGSVEGFESFKLYKKLQNRSTTIKNILNEHRT